MRRTTSIYTYLLSLRLTDLLLALLYQSRVQFFEILLHFALIDPLQYLFKVVLLGVKVVSGSQKAAIPLHRQKLVIAFFVLLRTNGEDEQSHHEDLYNHFVVIINIIKGIKIRYHFTSADLFYSSILCFATYFF